jgi:hypothetical protein
MTVATSRAGTAHPSGALEFTPIFSGVCVAQSLIFSFVICILSTIGFLAIVMSLFLIFLFFFPYELWLLNTPLVYQIGLNGQNKADFIFVKGILYCPL